MVFTYPTQFVPKFDKSYPSNFRTVLWTPLREGLRC